MAKLELVTDKKQQEAARKQEEEKLKLTRDEIATRLRRLRKELEAAKQRYDGALFDNFTDGIPPSLDHVGVNREPFGAVYHLSPLLEAWVEQLQNGKVKSCLSDDVFELFFFSTQTAYEIGMLAGAIYMDSPTATIDRFERGLVTALAACHWIIKEERS
jgi:hypothetical protein